MKHGLKILVGSLALASSLMACAKKSGSPAASTPATGAYGACVLQNGTCVSGVTSGFFGRGRWSGRLIVSSNNMAQYQAFLAANGVCYQVTGWRGGSNPPCTMVSGYFDLTVETVEDRLPGRANFEIVARFINGQGRKLHTSADAYMNAAQNGFQLSFVRQYASPYGFGGVRYDRWRRPIGVYNPALATQQSPALQIVLVFADATRQAVNAQVTYGGTLIGSTSGNLPLFGEYDGSQYAPGAHVPGQYIGGQYLPNVTDAPKVAPYIH